MKALSDFTRAGTIIGQFNQTIMCHSMQREQYLSAVCLVADHYCQNRVARREEPQTQAAVARVERHRAVAVLAAKGTSYKVAEHTLAHTDPDRLGGRMEGSRMREVVGVDSMGMASEQAFGMVDRMQKVAPLLSQAVVLVALVEGNGVQSVDNIGGMPSVAGDSCVLQRAAPLETWAVEERTDTDVVDAVVDNTPYRVGYAWLNCNAAVDGDDEPSLFAHWNRDS